MPRGLLAALACTMVRPALTLGIKP
jgi:hypothetical protein